MSGEAQAESPSPKVIRLRDSQITLWFLIFIVALSIFIWRLGAEVIPLREEVKRLREEAGHLLIDEDYLDRLQAIAVPQDYDNTWKWKIYLPAGRGYQFVSKWNDVPSDGLPNTRNTTGYSTSTIDIKANRPREFTVIVSVRKRPHDQWWTQTIDMIKSNGAKHVSAKALPQAAHEWFDNPPNDIARGGVLNEQKISETPRSLVLLREHGTENQPDGLSKGNMLWIEEIRRLTPTSATNASE